MHFGAFFYGTVDMPDAGVEDRRRTRATTARRTTAARTTT